MDKRYFMLKHGGGYVAAGEDEWGTLTVTHSTHALHTIFEFIDCTPRTAGALVRMLPLFSDYYVRIGRDNQLFADGWKGDGAFALHALPGENRYALTTDHLTRDGCLSVSDDGTIVSAEVKSEDAGPRETFELVSADELARALTEQTGCYCGTRAAESPDAGVTPADGGVGPLGWEDKTHAWIVTEGVNILKHTLGHTDAVSRLVRLLDIQWFIDEVMRGVHDADYVRKYSKKLYAYHFYDPEAGRGLLRGPTNALTECQKYASAAFERLKAAGWSHQADGKILKAAAYDLGISLHFFTDLTQPMHAANFANVLPTGIPGDRRHTGFEMLAEKEKVFRGRNYNHDFRNMSPAQEEGLQREVLGLVGRSLKSVVLRTAEYSKETFKQFVKGPADAKVIVDHDGHTTVDSDWTIEEAKPAYDRSFTYGPKALAAFLATLCELPTPDERRVYRYEQGRSGTAPCFVEFLGQGLMFWSFPVEPQRGLWYARFDPATNTFNKQARVYNPDPSLSDVYYSQIEAPAAAVLDNTLYLAWRHGSGDLYLSHMPSRTGPSTIGWSPARKLTPAFAQPRPLASPALVAYGKRVLVLWANGDGEGGESQKDIWCGRYDPNTGFFNIMTHGVPGVPSQQTPAAAVYDGSVMLAGRDRMTSFNYDEEGWSSQPIPLPQDFDAAGAPSLVVAGETLHLLWRRRGDNRIVVRKFRRGGSPGEHEWYGEEVLDVNSHSGVGTGVINGKLLIGWTEESTICYTVRDLAG